MLRFLYISACLMIVSNANQDHTEKLFIRQLPQGRTLAHFEFVTTWDSHHLTFSQAANGTVACYYSPRLFVYSTCTCTVRHYGLFPKSLAEVMSHYGAQEVHLTLTQGMWRSRLWGYPPISAPLGAELWAWFLPGTK